MSDCTPIWGWLVKGLGGVVVMIERMCAEHVPLTRHLHGQLDQLATRLRECVDKAAADIGD